MLCGAAICCISKRQRCVTTSTCWAELVALSLCAAEVVYVRMVLEDIGRAQTAPTLLFVDNEAARAVARDPVLNSQMKHVARRHFYAREMESDGEIEVTRVHTNWNIADALTKALGRDRFRELTAQFRRARVVGGRALAVVRALGLLE